MRNRRQDIIIGGVEAVLIGLTLLGFAKAIWISLDIDESYAVACAYRMVRGDRLIRDMWEPHQLSAFLAALFAAPYIRMRGNTDYLVIYLRIIGVLIHTGMGVLLYRRLAKHFHSFFAFCIMILHLNFLPKWVQLPEFELMHYWCLLGIFLILYAYFTDGKSRMTLPFFGGCLLVVSMLSYPTMILLYPFYIFAICMLERRCCTSGAAKWWKSSAAFTLGSLLTGMSFLAYLLSYMSPDALKRYISYIFLDTSHGVYTMGEKWAMYLKQMQEQAGFYGWYLLTAAGITLVLCLIYRLVVSRNTSHEGSPKRQVLGKDIWPVVITVLTLAGLLMQIKAIAGFLFEDENQFFFQVRHIAVMLPALLICVRYYRKMAIWLYLSIIPGLVSVTAVLFVTNMDTNTTYAKAFIGVLGSLLIIYQYGREIMASSWKKVFMVLSYTLGGMLLAGFLVCRLILIRVSGCQPVTIRAALEKMEYGPEKGIYILEDTANIWNSNYRELEKAIDRGDRVLYIGAESLIYVGMEALPATPSTQGTTVYNEMFLRYYEEHPDRIPNVIVYDKTFGENPMYSLYYDFSLQNPVFFQWIEENYRDAQKTETDYMIILRQ
ncbi:MAG: hypothetical protein K2H45_01710 [Acetatifactor sp.]|nr:hypothetical protein [Acetatifactor sp.]